MPRELVQQFEFDKREFDTLIVDSDVESVPIDSEVPERDGRGHAFDALAARLQANVWDVS
jgi:hypothetical protein